MIEGVHVDIPSDEVREHLKVRAEYHLERARWYEQRATQLEDGGVEATQSSGGDPVASLRSKRDEHQNKADHFLLLAKYLPDGETMRLNVSNLRELEYTQVARQW